MKKILVATDGSDHAGKAVDLAADMASKFDADLIILHVSGHTPLTESERHLVDVELADEVLKYVAEDPHDIFEGYAQSGISDFFLGHEKRDMAVRAAIGHAILERAETAAKKHAVKSIKTIQEGGDPAGKIVQKVTEERVDLVVVGSRGVSEIAGLIGGSVSNKVNHHAEVTVITVK